MKYYQATIAIPYFDSDGMKQWMAINIKSKVDRRRILRGVRKFVQDNFQKRVSNDWVKMHCRITGRTDVVPYGSRVQSMGEKLNITQHSERMDKIALELMRECEDDEAKGCNGDEIERCYTEATGLPVSSLSATFNRCAKPQDRTI